LSSVGLIAIDDNQNINLTAAAAPLLEAVFGLCAGFQWQRVSRLNDGSLSINERIALPCAGGQILSLSVTAAGLLRLACPSRDEITAFLASELAGTADGLTPPKEAAAPAAQARRFCEHCGHPVGAADHFCGECGRELY
jgi:DNA-binding IclR family transcriptional regulator